MSCANERVRRPYEVGSIRSEGPFGVSMLQVIFVAGRGRSFTLLIVDDDPLMTDMLPRRLKRFVRDGVEIQCARTVVEAKEMIRALRPDAVLSDYNLREIETGLDVLREALATTPQAARILFSGHTAHEIDGLGEAPIHAYLEKPMKLDELIPPMLAAIEEATGEDLRGGPAGA